MDQQKEIKGLLYKIGIHGRVYRWSREARDWVLSTMSAEKFKRAAGE